LTVGEVSYSVIASLHNEVMNNFLGLYMQEQKDIYITKENCLNHGVKHRDSYRGLFKRLEISHLPCEYIFPLINITPRTFSG
jgi:hypothetical protein